MELSKEWKTMRKHWTTIDGDSPAVYNQVISAIYALGTTPIHVYMMYKMFKDQMYILYSSL